MNKNVKDCVDKFVMRVAKRGANSASMWQFYQPKEPQGLKKLKK